MNTSFLNATASVVGLISAGFVLWFYFLVYDGREQTEQGYDDKIYVLGNTNHLYLCANCVYDPNSIIPLKNKGYNKS